MRLLEVATFELKEHVVEPYAILSHRWYSADQEVTFADFQRPGNAPHKKGFGKLQSLCEVARSKGYEYVWCDTCCIDKTSTTELSESIRSMFRWYRDAAECIAYLEDVGGPDGRELEQSVWLKRGWTLQELIAPKRMSFYGHCWQPLGTKEDLLNRLSNATRIPSSVLTQPTEYRRCSIAQRMSWASDRETARIEDQAYSLMGLFDLSLNMLYGEGEQAFIELQRSIIKTSADQSIFCWSLDDHSHPQGYSGLLAPSPRSFAKCKNVVTTDKGIPYEESNIGLDITLPTLPYAMDTYYAFLNCAQRDDPASLFAILIARLPTTDQYARVRSRDGLSVSLHDPAQLRQAMPAKQRRIWIRDYPEEAPLNRTYGFWLRTIEPRRHESSEICHVSRAATSEKDRVITEPRTAGTAGIISVKPTNNRARGWSHLRWIKLGFDDDFHPVIMIASSRCKHGVLDGETTQSLFDQTLDHTPGSPAHKQLFADDRWVRTDVHKSRQITPGIQNGWSDGYYVLTFNKPSVSRYDFPDLNLRIRMSMLPDCSPDGGPVQQSIASSIRQIWTVELTAISSFSPEHARREEHCAAFNLSLIGFFLALTGCPCLWQEGVAQMKQFGTCGCAV